MLQATGISTPELRARALPHELSGGLRQRALLALALACEAAVLLADEPTTALDVTLQAQVLQLLRALGAERQLGMLLISHDLGVIAETCETTAILYAGHVVEQAETARLFAQPRHPYTAALLAARPRLVDDDAPARLAAIPGSVPRMSALPVGCRFQGPVSAGHRALP